MSPPGPSGPGTGLARYVAAATLARSADTGGVVAIVLLVTGNGGPGWLAGLLGACLTFPHLFGPFLARRLDTADDGRRVLAAACLAHGGALAAAVLLYPHVWIAVTTAVLVACGVTGPLLTGGISSRLPAIAGAGTVAQRRAQGWDVATYGIGGTIGPTIVVTVTAWADATAAALLLAAATALAAALVRLLPADVPPVGPGEVPSPLQTLRTIAGTGPLRRTLYLTSVVALSVAVLPVTAVSSAGRLDVSPATAGALTALYGVGGLAASVLVMIRPLRGDPDRAMPVLAVVIGVALALVAAAPTFWMAAACYTAVGLLNSTFFATTLAARSEYAPLAARGQIFVWIAAVKITAGSAGTAAGGALVGQAVHLPVVVGACLTTLAAAVAVGDRRTARN